MDILPDLEKDLFRYIDMNYVLKRLISNNFITSLYQLLKRLYSDEFAQIMSDAESHRRRANYNAIVIHNTLILKQNLEKIFQSVSEKVYRIVYSNYFPNQQKQKSQSQLLPTRDIDLSQVKLSPKSKHSRHSFVSQDDSPKKIFNFSQDPGPGSYYPQKAQKLVTRNSGSPKFSKAKRKSWVQEERRGQMKRSEYFRI